MAFQTPSFENSYCEYFAACGELVSNDRELKEWLGQESSRDIKFRAKSQMAYLYVMSGGRRGFHVHFDVATTGYFDQRKKPKQNSKRADVQKYFNHISGNLINVRVTSHHRFDADVFPRANLIQMLKSLEYTSDDGKTRIRALGLELTTEDQEIESVTCHLDGEEVTAVLETNLSIEIDDSYLVSVLHHIDQLLITVFGKEDKE